MKPLPPSASLRRARLQLAALLACTFALLAVHVVAHVDGDSVSAAAIEMVLLVAMVPISIGLLVVQRRLAVRQQADLIAALQTEVEIRRSTESALRQSESAQIESRRFLEALIDSLEEGIVACDADGNATFANEATRLLHGVDDDTGPEDWDDHFTLAYPDGRPMPDPENPMRRALAGERVIDAPMVINRRDGDHRYVICRGRPILDERGAKVGAVVALRDVSERMRVEQALQDHRVVDALTGLPNRVALRERLREAARAQRHDDRVGVLHLDVDGMAAINDSRGLEFGDQVLVAVAARISLGLREGDFVARVDGDSFVVVCTGVGSDPVEQLGAIAERVSRSLDRPIHVETSSVPVSVSIGSTIVDAGQDVDEALAAAESAMRTARARGRARHAHSDPSTRAQDRSRLDRERELVRAVEEGQLAVRYQPVIDIASERMVGVEALVRWSHPHRGELSPGQFLPLAEEMGLMDRIGGFVLDQAVADAARWVDRDRDDLDDLSVAVNLSVSQLEADDLAEDVLRVLVRHRVDSRRLVLEMTESMILDAGPATVESIGVLRGAGIRLALDDFGTGYSSLSHLRALPVDLIKIDQSFISGLGTSARDTAIVEALLRLADHMGVEVVAEGIETRDQLERLAQLECQQAQGFYLGRPVTASDIEARWRAEALIAQDRRARRHSTASPSASEELGLAKPTRSA